MILTIVFIGYMSHSENIQPNKSFSLFPKKIEDWYGEEYQLDQKIYDILGVTDSIIYKYSNPEGQQVELYIGFYKSQKEGCLIHSPKNCMPGSGWNLVKIEKSSIFIDDSNRQEIAFNDVLLQKGNEKQIMFYWFQGRGRYITSEYMQKVYLVIDSITKHRTDEAFIRVIAPVIDDNEKETRRYLIDFTRLLVPLMQEYLPS